MDGRRLFVGLIALLVVLPTTLVAAFFTVLFCAAWLTGAFRDSQAPFPPLLLAAAILAGWFGIISLWRLCIQFWASPALPRRWRLDAAGLLFGIAAALTLVVGLGVEDYSLLLFFLWPVIAALALGALLLHTGRASGKPEP